MSLYKEIDRDAKLDGNVMVIDVEAGVDEKRLAVRIQKVRQGLDVGDGVQIPYIIRQTKILKNALQGTKTDIGNTVIGIENAKTEILTVLDN